MLWTLAILAATATDPVEDPVTRRAREEIEAQLALMDQAPAPELEIRFEGVSPARYELVEASFALDDQPLKEEGGLLEKREVGAGEHVLTGSVLVKDKAAGRILSYAEDYRYRVPVKVTLMVQRGLRLEVHLRVRGDDSPLGLSNELKAEVRVDALMLGPAGDEEEAGAEEAAPDAGTGKFDGGRPYTKMKTGNWKKKKSAKAKRLKPYTKMKTGEWVSAGAPKKVAPKKVAPKKAKAKKAAPTKATSGQSP